MDKEDVYIHNEILLSHKKVWNNVVCSNMNILRDYCTKWITSDKDRYMISLMCGIQNMAQMNLSTKQKQTPRHREQSCGCQEGGAEGRMKWEFGVSGCKLVYIEWIKNKVLSKAMVFPVVMYGCESWIINKAERCRIDAFELWCWRRLLRVPWTARRSN